MQWSPDGRRLVYVAAADAHARLFVVEAASGVISAVRFATGEHDLANPAWSADGRSLLYAAVGAAGPRLMRASLDAGAAPQPISGYGWTAAIETPEGVFARQLTQRGIWRLAPGRAPEQVFAEPTGAQINWLWSERDWTIANGRFYVVDESAPGGMRILSRAIAGGAVTRVADAGADFAGALAVNPSTGEIVYGVHGDTASDIALLRFRRR